VKEVMQGKGERIVFVDGYPALEDRMRARARLYQQMDIRDSCPAYTSAGRGDD